MVNESYGVKDRAKNQKHKVECIRCGSIIGEITECHLKWQNCGAELTCSDKGNFC